MDYNKIHSTSCSLSIGLTYLSKKTFSHFTSPHIKDILVNSGHVLITGGFFFSFLKWDLVFVFVLLCAEYHSSSARRDEMTPLNYSRSKWGPCGAHWGFGAEL